MGPIDLRSDTVTRPTAAMLDAMRRAPVGDDVLGDDPTVRELEERFAAHVGKQGACFVPTGTMANQVCLRAHTQPGDEIIAHEDSHIIHYETGAPAVISGCMVRPLRGEHGQFDPSDVTDALRPDNIHAPHSALLVVENTHNRGGGSVWTIGRVRAVTKAARDAGLRCHLDGARLWNASVASGTPMREYAAEFDSVSCCFSKGLGAPVGSIVGADRETISRIRRHRKMLGGAMRQSGILAAACLHAMEHHVARLAQDHGNARRLAETIARVPGLSVTPGPGGAGPQTNIVYFDIDPGLGIDGNAFSERLREKGVLMLATAKHRLRAVTHLDVSAEDIDRAAGVIGECARG